MDISKNRAQVEIAALGRDLLVKKLERDQALALIAERMRSVTSATAAAIALADGGRIVCRASSGNAPSVGALVDPDSGLSGECLRTGKLVRCHDTETDPRADRNVCRSLDLRSMVIVPVRMQGRPAGVVEVFSSRPHAFKTSHELLLQKVTGLVAEVAVRGAQPAPPQAPTAIAASRTGSKLPERQPDLETQSSRQKIPAIATATQVAPWPSITEKEQPKSRASAIVKDWPVLPVKSASETTEEAGRDAATEEAAAPASAIPSMFANLLAGAERLIPSRVRVAGVGVLLMVLLVGIRLGWRVIRPANSTPTGSQLNPVKAEESAAIGEPARLPAGRTKTTSNAAPGKQKAARRAAAITLPAPDIANSSAPPAITMLARPVEEASPISTVLGAPVAAPNLDAANVSPRSGGKLISKVDPIYPPSVAQRAHGEVVLRAKINRKGQVTKVTVVRGPAVLAQAAVAAIIRWRYEPFLLNGIPTEVENDIVLNFKPLGQ